MYTFERTTDIERLRTAHVRTFDDSADCPDFSYGAWWMVVHPLTSVDAGFCGIVKSSLGRPYAYLKRAGVIPEHRGMGLQRRMIRVREAWARREGYETVVTDAYDNLPSANNLIRAGYTLWKPAAPWSFKHALYFRKKL